jgi:hypothetical protein
VHSFSDTNQIILWEDQPYVPSDLYKLSALGDAGAGTTTVTLGIKTGTGDTATGSQGCTFAAASTGQRWTMDFDDANLSSIGLYGCSFIHGGDFQLGSSAIECISTLYIDCTSATVSNSRQQRCSIIDANTADGVGFMTTDDLSDIKYCSFSFSDGHGVTLTTPRVASQTSLGNSYIGYGSTGSNDAAIYNNSAGSVTISVSGGDTPTYRNGTSASTTVNAGTVSVTVKVLKPDGSNLQDANVLLKAAAGGSFPVNASVSIVNSGTTATVTHTGHGLASNDKVLIKGASLTPNNGVFTITLDGVDPTNKYSYTMGSAPGSNPTGATATFVVLQGLTDVNGEKTMSRSFGTAQPVTGWVRKSSSAPYYKTFNIGGTVSTTAGYSATVQMILDS